MWLFYICISLRKRNKKRTKHVDLFYCIVSPLTCTFRWLVNRIEWTMRKSSLLFSSCPNVIDVNLKSLWKRNCSSSSPVFFLSVDFSTSEEILTFKNDLIHHDKSKEETDQRRIFENDWVHHDTWETGRRNLNIFE